MSHAEAVNLGGIGGIPVPKEPKPPDLSITWMSQEVSKRLGSVGYNPNIPHL